MSRYGLEIRAASQADAAGVAELMAACGRPLSPDATSHRLTALGATPAAALLALEWGPPSGVVVAHWVPTLDADAPVAWLSLLLVSPDARRRGVGRALLKAVSQAGRQAGCETLRVVADTQDSSLPLFCLATGFETQGGFLVRRLRKRS